MLSYDSILEKTTRQAIIEIEKVSQAVALWTIEKNGQLYGKITSRWTKTRNNQISHVAFIMYCSKECPYSIGAVEVMSGFGYDRTAFGIGKIFYKLRQHLREYYGIKFECQDWEIINRWERFFRQSGYEVFRVL